VEVSLRSAGKTLRSDEIADPDEVAFVRRHARLRTAGFPLVTKPIIVGANACWPRSASSCRE